MKLVDAIYSSESLIRRLIFSLVMMSLLLVILVGALLFETTKPALVIERSCESKMIQASSDKRTTDEVVSFIKDALSARFDSDREKPSLLTQAQAETKSKEMRELVSRKVSQKIFVDEVSTNSDGSFRANLTRLVRLDRLRTALGFSVEAKVFEVPRSEDNPYGLILSEVKLLDSEVKK
jgi:hypothetical protein